MYNERAMSLQCPDPSSPHRSNIDCSTGRFSSAIASANVNGVFAARTAQSCQPGRADCFSTCLFDSHAPWLLTWDWNVDRQCWQEGACQWTELSISNGFNDVTPLGSTAKCSNGMYGDKCDLQPGSQPLADAQKRVDSLCSEYLSHVGKKCKGEVLMTAANELASHVASVELCASVCSRQSACKAFEFISAGSSSWCQLYAHINPGSCERSLRSTTYINALRNTGSPTSMPAGASEGRLLQGWPVYTAPHWLQLLQVPAELQGMKYFLMSQQATSGGKTVTFTVEPQAQLLLAISGDQPTNTTWRQLWHPTGLRVTASSICPSNFPVAGQQLASGRCFQRAFRDNETAQCSEHCTNDFLDVDATCGSFLQMKCKWTDLAAGGDLQPLHLLFVPICPVNNN